MTRRISLRPAASATALIAFVAVVLSLLGVSSLALRRGPEAQPFDALASRPEPGSSTLPEQTRQAAHKRPTSTVSPALHRTSGQTAERRLTAAALGQSAELHYPGGSPDVAVLPPEGRQFPEDLVDLAIDAFAEVVATTVSASHRGRAPPVSGYAI